MQKNEQVQENEQMQENEQVTVVVLAKMANLNGVCLGTRWRWT